MPWSNIKTRTTPNISRKLSWYDHKFDLLSTTLESLLQEIKNNKTNLQELQQTPKNNPYVPPFQKNNNRITLSLPHSIEPNKNPHPRPSILPSPSLLQHTTIKLEFLVYKGDETIIEWIHQVEQLFRYHHIPEIELVSTCLFHLKDDAQKWFNWLSNNVKNCEVWKIFKEEIIVRFAPSELREPFGAFANLKQISIVQSYLTRFEQLQGLLPHLHPDYVFDKFLDGWKEDIRIDV